MQLTAVLAAVDLLEVWLTHPTAFFVADIRPPAGKPAEAKLPAAKTAGEASAGTLQGEARVIDAAAATSRGTLSMTVTVDLAAGDLRATLVRLIAMPAGQAIDRLA